MKGEFKVLTKHSDKKNKDYLALYFVCEDKEYFITFMRWVEK